MSNTTRAADHSPEWWRHTLEAHAIPALQAAYRKHVQGDERIGWEELGEKLMHALCECMGDRGFQEWLKERSE